MAGECPAGYSKRNQSGADEICADVDECADGLAKCDVLTRCINVFGSYVCDKCPSGYYGNGANGCHDVDECAINNGGCDGLSSCINKPGTFSCGECPAGFSGSGATGCSQINECASNLHNCHPLVECTDIVGSFLCGRCPSGYEGNGEGPLGCSDIDECFHAELCPKGLQCFNLPGGYECAVPDQCPNGYTRTEQGCTDEDECGKNNGGCDMLTDCTNIDGGFLCSQCPPGYSGEGKTGCTDLNECLNNNGGCDPLTKCINTAGSFSCEACPTGYNGTAATGCVDINECAGPDRKCHEFVECVNYDGGYSCTSCPPGFQGSGYTGCIDVNECLWNNGNCGENIECVNLVGSYACGRRCRIGYTESEDGCYPIAKQYAPTYFRIEIDANYTQIRSDGDEIATVLRRIEEQVSIEPGRLELIAVRPGSVWLHLEIHAARGNALPSREAINRIYKLFVEAKLAIGYDVLDIVLPGTSATFNSRLPFVAEAVQTVTASFAPDDTTTFEMNELLYVIIAISSAILVLIGLVGRYLYRSNRYQAGTAVQYIQTGSDHGLDEVRLEASPNSSPGRTGRLDLSPLDGQFRDIGERPVIPRQYSKGNKPVTADTGGYRPAEDTLPIELTISVSLLLTCT